jgi:hypothetical protein
MEMKVLEQQLNTEYADIGVITINHLQTIQVDIEDIHYIKSVLDIVEPLDDNTPIVIAKLTGFFYRDCDEKYILVDGYHRLRHHIDSGAKTLTCIKIDYDLERHNRFDSFYEFIESCKGKTIHFIDHDSDSSDYFVHVNNFLYKIIANEGGCSCSAWDAVLNIHTDFVGVDIDVVDVSKKNVDSYYPEDEYELFINGVKIADVDTAFGDGYYGGDFEIEPVCKI